jgi:hypothetical protein
MTKFIPILNSIISEQKRDFLRPEVYSKLEMITDILWNLKNKVFDRRTFVTDLDFKVRDGEDGKIGIYINPRLKYIALLDKRPKSSTDPKKFVLDLNSEKFGSKKNLFLTLYHEYMHATDPNLSTKQTDKYLSSYSPDDNKKYWGHPIEFRAISNEFLEALVMEFKRRLKRNSTAENKVSLLKSIQNITNYFKNGENLSNYSFDILSRMNDENLSDNRISQVLSNIQTDFPKTSEIIPIKSNPYFLKYILLIKKNNPEIWKRFLTMLSKTVDEIEEIIETIPTK